MDTKKLFLWSLYSFSNAFVEIVFILYFSQWLVIDRGLSDSWFNATLVISSILVLFAAPLAASWGDEGGRRLPGLRFGTFAAALCLGSVGIIAALYPQYAMLAVVMFTGGIFFFLFAGIFWSALLPDITRSDHFGRASGWGQFGDWIGEMTALLIILPFVSGTIILFGSPGRAQAFIPTTFLFLFFSLPMLLLYREKTAVRARSSLYVSYRNSLRNFAELARTNRLGWFFLAFFFFNDAIITVANNFPIYLQRVFGVSDITKSLLLLGILASAAVGSLAGGWLTDRFGYRKMLLANVGTWIILLPSMALAQNFMFFCVLTIIMGLWFGSVWVMARSLIAHLAPPRALSRAFAYYTLMERFATLIGPIFWSILVAFVPATHQLNYRIALIGMTFFVVIGFLIAQKVPSQSASSLVS